MKKNLDPEFSGAVGAKPDLATRPARLVRRLIYVYACFALLTAAEDIRYVIQLHATGDPYPRGHTSLEGVAILAFLASFWMPPAILITAKTSGPRGWAFWRTALVTLALAYFQWGSIFPAFS
jgi:hypothetical protein